MYYFQTLKYAFTFGLNINPIAINCITVFKVKIVLILVSFIPSSGKGEKGALKE